MRSKTEAQSRKRKKRGNKILAFIELTFLTVTALLLLFLGAVVWNLSTTVPNIGAAENFDPNQSTKIYAANGELLATVFHDENREYVPLAHIPKDLQNATVAVEDKRFYEHNGVDFHRIVGALWADLRNQSASQGASTITQQLVRNLYLTKRKVLSRKVQEALLAVQLERKLSKQEILERYLNEVYYGAKAYGVQAAAHTYFDKPVSKLTLAECALLAGLPQRPTDYSPYHDIVSALDRRNTVLALMAQLHYITAAQARAAEAEKIKLAYSKPSLAHVKKAPYFVDMVLDQLLDRYGPDLVFKGGLRVYTTLSPEMQEAADRAVTNGVKRAREMGAHQAALICIDPHNGYIRAMVGGANYRQSQLNRTILQQPRQPGSSFKPIMYAAAFERGVTPNDTVDDDPISFPDLGPHGTTWRPKNYDNRWHGTMTIEEAIAESINIPAIKTIERIGPAHAVEMAHRLGITDDVRPNLSLAIGTSGVSMLNMATAYGAFATDGFRAAPIAITRVTDSQGLVIEDTQPKVRAVLKPDVVHEIDECLSAVTHWGTAARVAPEIPDARGKTGTTQNDRDAWFIGYTPALVAAVWVGNDNNQPMNHAFGSTACSPIWVDFMEKALPLNAQLAKSLKKQKPGTEKQAKPLSPLRKRWKEYREEQSTPGPSDLVSVTLCDDTGQLATPYCPHTHVEQFERGSQPTERCTLHTADSAATQANAAGGGDNPVVPAIHRTAQTNGSPAVDSPPPAPSPAVAAPQAQVPDTTLSNPTDEPARPRTRTHRHHTRYVVVSICRATGLLANDYCPDRVERRFPVDEAPTTYCRLHGPLNNQ